MLGNAGVEGNRGGTGRDRVENGGCETAAAPFEIVTMINRVGIVYLGGASPSTCTQHGQNYIFPVRMRFGARVESGESAREPVARSRARLRAPLPPPPPHRSVYICRFQRVLIERTHAATLSCTLGEQCSPPSSRARDASPSLSLSPVASRRGKRRRSAIKYPGKPS